MTLFVVLLVIVIAIVNLFRFLANPNDPQRRRDFDDGFGGCCMSGESGCDADRLCGDRDSARRCGICLFPAPHHPVAGREGGVGTIDRVASSLRHGLVYRFRGCRFGCGGKHVVPIRRIRRAVSALCPVSVRFFPNPAKIRARYRDCCGDVLGLSCRGGAAVLCVARFLGG